MKIAYVFFGQVKNFCEKQHFAFKQNIEKQLSNFHIDFFLTTSLNDSYLNKRQGENEKINPKSINKFFKFKDIYYDNEHDYPDKEIINLSIQIQAKGEVWKEGDSLKSISNSLKQLYGLEYFYKNFLKHQKEYDYIILSRSDIYHTHPISISFTQQDKDLWVPRFDGLDGINFGHYGGLNDRFAVIKTSKALEVYCNRFSALKNNIKKYHAESFLKEQVQKHNLNYGEINFFLFELIRANNKISDFVGLIPDEKQNTYLKNISRSFFINLDRRTDRLHHILRNLNFFSERFSAVNAKQLSLNKEIKILFKSNYHKLSKSAIACFLSHYRLWRKLINDTSSDNYLILEDDVVFHEKFEEYWNSIFCNHLPSDFNLIYLGGCQPWNRPRYTEVLKPHNKYFNTIKTNDLFTKGDTFWHMTTCSYIISKKCAQKLCKYLETNGIDTALDFFLIKSLIAMKEDHSIFHLNPLLANQLHEEGGNTAIDTKSDIRNDNETFKKIEATKIIHQNWTNWKTGSTEIPYEIYKKEWIESWKNHNPDWEYILWNDESNRNLVKESYPQYLSLYDGYERKIAKCDIVRFFYMHKFGGIYVDLDFHCLKPIETIIEADKINLGCQKMKNETVCQNNIPNALIYSPPKQDFWIQCVEELSNHKYDKEGKLKNTEEATGPIFLKHCLDKFKPSNLKIHTYEKFYPISWDIDGSNYCNNLKQEWIDYPEKYFKDSFAVTYWSGAWRQSNNNKKLNMIWQTEGGKKACFEGDWIDEIFECDRFNNIDDGEYNIIKDNSAIIYSNMIPKNSNQMPEVYKNKNEQLAHYFEKFKNLDNCYLIHLSDEHCVASIEHYKYFRHVFRQYYREDAVADNVTFMPLGYKKGF